ncbi:NADPH-dependent FMN reductase, partial [Rhizobiaceae sp. 2RAB30]
VDPAENLRPSKSDWLRFMKLVPAGSRAQIDRYIGYWKPYATSHEALDEDEALKTEVRNAAATLAEAVQQKRTGRLLVPGEHLQDPRRK